MCQDSREIKSALNFIFFPSQKKKKILHQESARLVKQYGTERELLFAHHPSLVKYCMGDSAVIQPHSEQTLGWQ